MPTLMTFDEHLAAIEDNCARLLHDASARSLSDAVPSCPEWSVADLVQHHGGVMRWAAAIVAEQRTDNLSEAELEAVMAAPGERHALYDWYSDAARRLTKVLAESPDLQALVFLADAPAPRLFWARRQAHEATIHRVDALSALLGHLPTAGSTGISTELAVDGIDELLTGFLPRRSSGLRMDEEVTVLVAPTDADFAWTVRVGPDTPVTTRGAAPNPDATLTGSAVGLYLGLWNRGDEIAEHGLEPVLGLWRDKVRIRWS
jgi:uncharacterized protein (TIGR03083 family)